MKSILTWFAASSLLATLAIAQPHYTVTDLGVVGPEGQPFFVTPPGLVSGAAVATRNTPPTLLL
jgi:hypothetical protein